MENLGTRDLQNETRSVPEDIKEHYGGFVVDHNYSDSLTTPHVISAIQTPHYHHMETAPSWIFYLERLGLRLLVSCRAKLT